MKRKSKSKSVKGKGGNIFISTTERPDLLIGKGSITWSLKCDALENQNYYLTLANLEAKEKTPFFGVSSKSKESMFAKKVTSSDGGLSQKSFSANNATNITDKQLKELGVSEEKIKQLKRRHKIKVIQRGILALGIVGFSVYGFIIFILKFVSGGLYVALLGLIFTILIIGFSHKTK